MNVHDTVAGILVVVPVGRENAIPAMAIWQKLGMWARVTVKQRLNFMVEDNIIHRAVPDGGMRHVYWKDAA